MPDKEENKKGNKARKVMNKIREQLKEMFHDFVDWIQENLAPELKNFLEDNMDLAMEIVVKVAKEYAGKPSHIKFDSVYNALEEEFKDNTGNLTIDNQWIRLIIELAVSAAKASGKI